MHTIDHFKVTKDMRTKLITKNEYLTKLAEIFKKYGVERTRCGYLVDTWVLEGKDVDIIGCAEEVADLHIKHAYAIPTLKLQTDKESELSRLLYADGEFYSL